MTNSLQFNNNTRSPQVEILEFQMYGQLTISVGSKEYKLSLPFLMQYHDGKLW